MKVAGACASGTFIAMERNAVLKMKCIVTSVGFSRLKGME